MQNKKGYWQLGEKNFIFWQAQQLMVNPLVLLFIVYLPEIHDVLFIWFDV